MKEVPFKEFNKTVWYSACVLLLTWVFCDSFTKMLSGENTISNALLVLASILGTTSKILERENGE